MFQPSDQRTPSTFWRRAAAFTLAEVMVAILFISIAFFGYMSLHIRLLHSGRKLELRQTHREAVGQEIATKIAAARRDGQGQSANADLPRLVQVSAEAEWEDKNGNQTYRVETFVLTEQLGW